MPLLPTITCVNGFDGELNENDLPMTTFQVFSAVNAAAVRLNGNCYVVTSVAGILVSVELELFGA